MKRQRANVVIACILLLLAVAVVASFVVRVREASGRSHCINNCRSIGLGIEAYRGWTEWYPCGTMINSKLPPEKRLSWLFAIDPVIHARMDPEWNKYRDEPWDSLGNTRLAQQRMQFYACPSNGVEFDAKGFAVTHYIGCAGTGADSPTLDTANNRAGVFGFDRRVYPADIKDGVSQTIMVLETSFEPGPYFAGGKPTVRGIDPTNGPATGRDLLFGGNHRKGTNAVVADGSYRLIANGVSARILTMQFTINGGESGVEIPDQ